MFGTSKAFVQPLGAGKDYRSLCPVYGLGIVNDIFDRKSDAWFHHYRTVNIKDSTQVLEGLELIFLELPKFKPQTFQHKKMGRLWLRFLREINDKLVDIPSEFGENAELRKAMELTQESSYTPAELEAYDKYWDTVSVERTMVVDALTAGEASGIEKGIIKGREEEKRATALKMSKKGMDVEMIRELTGLSVEEINFLV